MKKQVQSTDLSKSPSTRKMNRSGLIAYIAEANDVSFSEAEFMYSAVINAIRDVVFSGVRLSLQGFGAFYLQVHKGQPVRFSETKSVAQDYFQFKFSASKVLKKSLPQAGVDAAGS